MLSFTQSIKIISLKFCHHFTVEIHFKTLRPNSLKSYSLKNKFLSAAVYISITKNWTD